MFRLNWWIVTFGRDNRADPLNHTKHHEFSLARSAQLAGGPLGQASFLHKLAS
jgi:hypothetical protein